MKKIVTILLLFSSIIVHSQIRLPKLISDGMVLQRDTPIKIWGWATPKETVILRFKNQTFVTQADEKGQWLIKLPPQPAGGSFDLTFTASNTLIIHDVLFGDVWICSGQSNMELMMERVKDKYPTIVATASNPYIRQFTVPDIYNFEKPNDDLIDGQWISVNPKNIYSFSAVAYFFANELYAKHKVPVGLINAALGGSPIQAWMSESALKQFPIYYEEGIRFKDKNLIETVEKNNRQINKDWYYLLNRSDEGLKTNWHTSEYSDKDWKEMNIPNYWADVDSSIKTGSVWFRKVFNLPKQLVNQPSRLFLGRIVDADSVFINGRFIGTTSYQYPPRKYLIPIGILKEINNIISIRVVSSGDKGGFVPDKPYQINFPNDTISLKGVWKYKVGSQIPPIVEQNIVRWKPIGLYNAMIAPLSNFTMKGVIWYQGESNTNNPFDYKDLMIALIKDWRNSWQQGEFPFLYVQLANFLDVKPEPSESNWAMVRQAQLQVLSQPNTGMVVSIDLGEWNDIHPLNKQEVGKRLALQALKLAYKNKEITASGPIVQSLSSKKGTLVIHFTNVDKGLIALNNRKLGHFAVAGEDKIFVWAKAKIKKNSIIVKHKSIKNPIYVRYAWASNPKEANLYNKALLPASPFEIKRE
jgi:sialate O-acetylesterase